MHALEGVVVLDLTRLLPGAVATQWLANFGAEVIKIEQPGTGDYARQLGPTTFEETNRGKKSITLDLKSAADKDSLLGLLARADIVIEGFRPGVMERLGLGYETFRASNPRLIYVALTGYGPDGPFANLAGHDINYLSLAGVLDQIGVAGGPPVIPGVQLADLAGGSMQAVIGILLALAARERTGLGQRVDISMTDGAAALLPVIRGMVDATGVVPKRGAEMLCGAFACYNVYLAADGRYVSVGALESKFWQNLCNGLGCPHLIADHFAPEPRRSAMKAELAGIIATRPAEEWFALLGEKDCCLTPVRTIAEASTSAVVPRLSDTPGQAGLPAPALGAHNQEILGK
ncbi:MAG: CaiB/BaiF CoA-transferase family protein [Bryobacteraceae bacterium]